MIVDEILTSQKEIISISTGFLERAAKAGEMLLSPPEVKVGQTPADIVYRRHKAKLIRYRPVQEKLHRVPIVISFALINRPYILDLLPGRSVIEFLVKEGFDVYLVDWGIPTRSDKDRGLEVYVRDYLDHMVDEARRLSGSDRVTLMGYCMGGSMAMLYTALNQEKVQNLVVMTTPFDTADQDGILFQWCRDFKVQEVVDTFGIIPGWFFNSAFGLLKPLQPLEKATHFYRTMLDDGCNETFLAMEKWIGDAIGISGKAYGQLVKGLFQENLFLKNSFTLGEKAIDFREITCPFLNLVALNDDIVPPSSSLRIGEYLGSVDRELMTMETGHIGLSVSGKALKKLWPAVAGWLGSRSEPGHTA